MPFINFFYHWGRFSRQFSLWLRNKFKEKGIWLCYDLGQRIQMWLLDSLFCIRAFASFHDLVDRQGASADQPELMKSPVSDRCTNKTQLKCSFLDAFHSHYITMSLQLGHSRKFMYQTHQLRVTPSCPLAWASSPTPYSSMDFLHICSMIKPPGRVEPSQRRTEPKRWIVVCVAIIFNYSHYLYVASLLQFFSLA